VITVRLFVLLIAGTWDANDERLVGALLKASLTLTGRNCFQPAKMFDNWRYRLFMNKIKGSLAFLKNFNLLPFWNYADVGSALNK
jgi:hypothetical protein